MTQRPRDFPRDVGTPIIGFLEDWPMCIRRHVIRWAATVVAALVIAGGSMIAAGQGGSSKVDVTGAWDLEVKTEAGGTTTPSVTLKQDGEKLTGHYSSSTLGEADVTGTIKGQQIQFTFNAEVQGFALAVKYTGAVEGTTMKGTLSLGELGDGTFTGKKQP